MLNPIFFFTQHDMSATSQVSFSIMHIIITHTISCIYLANFIVWEMSYPYISCVKCYKFPLGNISLERDQTFIYIFKTPLLGLVQRYIIRDILTFPVMFSYRTHCHAPITCYIQFLSLCPWKVLKSFISKCIYDKSLTRKLAIWQIIFSPCVQYCNGVSAFTMYICTILHFPVHLKLDFQIFSFFFNLNISIFAVWHFLPWPVSNWTFRFFYCAFFPCTYAFLRGRHLAQSVSNWTFWFFQSCIFPLHICLFTR